MQLRIKVAVIGGTGKSGQYLVKQLVQQGFPVRMLLRHPENFQHHHPLIEIVKGDARDFGAVHSLIEGSQAVISTLGQPKGESSIFSQATKNVIRSMHDHNVRRYLVTTGLNVDSPGDKKGFKTQAATDWMKSNYPETTSDKQVEFQILSDRDVDWTLVRLPLIEQTELSGPIQVSLEDCPGDAISATSLAHFLIGQLTDDAYAKKAPFIANG